MPDYLLADEVPAYAAKYAERIGAIFGTVEQFAAVFSEPILISPDPPSRLRPARCTVDDARRTPGMCSMGRRRHLDEDAIDAVPAVRRWRHTSAGTCHASPYDDAAADASPSTITEETPMPTIADFTVVSDAAFTLPGELLNDQALPELELPGRQRRLTRRAHVPRRSGRDPRSSRDPDQ